MDNNVVDFETIKGGQDEPTPRTYVIRYKSGDTIEVLEATGYFSCAGFLVMLVDSDNRIVFATTPDHFVSAVVKTSGTIN
jgi:hypothetical protein